MKIPELEVIISSHWIMEQEDISLELVNLFPEYASQIFQLLLKNKDFREIAEDYQFCRYKLAGLSTDLAKNNSLIQHYQKTLEELEEEMMGYFSIEES